MTIRARLFAAMALTVLGPLVTIGVALSAFAALGDRFEEVRRANAAQALALDLKFSVTDMNGWQTAYGYDDGQSRTTFVTSAQQTADLLERARRALTAPRERALLDELGGAYDDFMRLDERAWAALQDDRPEVDEADPARARARALRDDGARRRRPGGASRSAPSRPRRPGSTTSATRRSAS